MSIQNELRALITQVFEREEEFIKQFCRCSATVDELDSFYMASERCSVSYFTKPCVSTGGRKKITYAISTNDFLNWIK